MKKKFVRAFLVLIVLFVAGFLVFSYFDKGIVYSLMNNDLNSIINYVSSFQNIATFIFIFLIILEVIFAPIPPLILYISGGVLFGSFLGGTYALIGNVLGAGIAFQISRNWGRNIIQKRISKRTKKKFDDFSEKHGPLSIFLLRLNPLTSSDIFSYISGLTKMKFWKFIIGTTAGLIPIIYFQSYLGESVKEHPLIFKFFLILGALYVLVFVGIFFWVRLQKKRKNKVNK